MKFLKTVWALLRTSALSRSVKWKWMSLDQGSQQPAFRTRSRQGLDTRKKVATIFYTVVDL